MNIFDDIKLSKKSKQDNSKLFLMIILVSLGFGFLGGILGIFTYIQFDGTVETKITEKDGYTAQTTQEEKIIQIVKEVSPAVVSIIISKDVPVFEEYYSPYGDYFGFNIPQYRQNGTEKQEVGGGTGVIVSKDGTVLTNKHVVVDEDAEYSVFTNDGKEFAAKVLARDPVTDLAILKIEVEDENPVDFPVAKLGSSTGLQMGQTVITIGNALGEFNNTVGVGVISGLSRTITATGTDFVENLENVIQTDAAINRGNSGGPLLNLKGEVIGINTAMVSGAQSIGFAIPINRAKKDIEQVKTLGKIVYPFLGVTYVLINEQMKEEKDLPVDYGVLISEGDSPAIWHNSPAEKAGLKVGDILLEFNGEKITFDNSLAKIIIEYDPGDEVNIKYLRDGEEKTVKVVLDEREE